MRPETLGQALRIPGITPAAVALVAAHVSGALSAARTVGALKRCPRTCRRTSSSAHGLRALRSLPSVEQKLLAYFELLTRWNRKINLTSLLES